MGNSRATSKVMHEPNTFDLFDRLPCTVRRAIANAQFDWTVSSCFRAFMAGAPESILIESIQRKDALEAAETRLRAWGEHYPQPQPRKASL